MANNRKPQIPVFTRTSFADYADKNKPLRTRRAQKITDSSPFIPLREGDRGRGIFE